MQGQLWSETVRTRYQLHSMIYPRIIALAERAWHMAMWEESEEGSASKKQDDWQDFLNTLSYKELHRLEERGIHYHLAPPGAR